MKIVIETNVMINKLINKGISIILLLVLGACTSKTNKTANENEGNGEKSNLPWLQNAVIYKVDLANGKETKNLKDFHKQLDSIKKLGIDILWFPALQPMAKQLSDEKINEERGIINFKAINPKLGTEDDFRNLVEKCHLLGLKIIMDWNSFSSSKNNPLVKEHPDWFLKNVNKLNGMVLNNSKETVELNYQKSELKSYMIEAQKWWIDQFDIDGFGCNEASKIPKDYWEMASKQIRKMKKVLMIAEADQPDLLENAFYVNYSWEFPDLLTKIYNGTHNADSLRMYFERKANYYSADAITLHHLKPYENYGDAEAALAALTFNLGGLPLINGGSNNVLLKPYFKMTAGNTEATNTNVKNPYEQYQILIELRHKNPAIWTNVDGATYTRIFKSNQNVFAFIKQSGENKVLLVANLSNKAVELDASELPGLELYSLKLYKNLITDGARQYYLGPWGYSVSTLNEPNE